MNKKIIITAFLLAAGLFATRNAQAQRTYEEMERLTVNEQVTTQPRNRSASWIFPQTRWRATNPLRTSSG